MTADAPLVAASSRAGPWRSAYSAALRTFRALPAPARRMLVRLGTPSYTVGAVCAIVCDGDVLALRQPHRPGWSLPGGLLSRGESAQRGVEREVHEETGLHVEVGLPVVTVVAARLRRVDVVFRVDVDDRFPVRAGGEALHAAWVPLAGLDDVDGPTRDILRGLERAGQPGAYAGRLVAPR
jgi:8-oxo-dGTP diphosphatase